MSHDTSFPLNLEEKYFCQLTKNVSAKFSRKMPVCGETGCYFCRRGQCHGCPRSSLTTQNKEPSFFCLFLPLRDCFVRAVRMLNTPVVKGVLQARRLETRAAFLRFIFSKCNGTWTLQCYTETNLVAERPTLHLCTQPDHWSLFSGVSMAELTHRASVGRYSVLCA